MMVNTGVSELNAQPLSHDDGQSNNKRALRIWRVALVIKSMQVKLVAELIDALSIGRFEEGHNDNPDIDLGPFNAAKSGVSHRHATLKVQDTQVFIVDNFSLRGTQVNGMRIDPDQPCRIQYGDKITLGTLDLQVQFLVNPLD